MGLKTVRGGPRRARTAMSEAAMIDLTAGITPAGEGQDGIAWNVLGHRYFRKAESDGVFCFETVDPPGTFVPLHIHPTQDEFIYVLEGVFDLELAGAKQQARVGDLVRMPRGVPHAYYNNQSVQARALFWVSPARRLRELFDKLHNLQDIDEVVRLSRECEINFVPRT
jgi:quercetin dioxygenase-like cupin family protein